MKRSMLGEIPLREVELSEPNSIATGRAPRQETACRAGWDTIDINRNESIINPVVHDRHDQGGCVCGKMGGDGMPGRKRRQALSRGRKASLTGGVWRVLIR